MDRRTGMWASQSDKADQQNLALSQTRPDTVPSRYRNPRSSLFLPRSPFPHSPVPVRLCKLLLADAHVCIDITLHKKSVSCLYLLVFDGFGVNCVSVLI